MPLEDQSIASMLNLIVALNGGSQFVPLLISVYEAAGIDTNKPMKDFPMELKQRIVAAEPLLIEIGTKLDELRKVLGAEC